MTAGASARTGNRRDGLHEPAIARPGIPRPLGESRVASRDAEGTRRLLATPRIGPRVNRESAAGRLPPREGPQRSSCVKVLEGGRGSGTPVSLGAACPHPCRLATAVASHHPADSHAGRRRQGGISRSGRGSRAVGWRRLRRRWRQRKWGPAIVSGDIHRGFRSQRAESPPAGLPSRLARRRHDRRGRSRQRVMSGILPSGQRSVNGAGDGAGLGVGLDAWKEDGGVSRPGTGARSKRAKRRQGGGCGRPGPRVADRRLGRRRDEERQAKGPDNRLDKRTRTNTVQASAVPDRWRSPSSFESRPQRWPMPHESATRHSGPTLQSLNPRKDPHDGQHR